MPKLHAFARQEVLPSYFMNVLQEFASGAISDLPLSQLNTTTVQVVPRAPLDIAALNIQGRYRYRTTTVTRAMPGGGAGTFTIWAVATDQVVDNSPDPFTDHTDYSFDLRITAGANPTGVGVEVFEKIGEADWDGSVITAIRQTYGSIPGAKIADGAVAATGRVSVVRQANGALLLDLVDGGVSTAKLADGGVVEAKLGPGAVTNGKLGDGSVGTSKLANLAVTEGKLADDSVTTAKLAALAVTAAELADAAVTAAKLAGNSVGSANIQANAVLTAAIAALAVTTGKIADGAVTNAKMAAAAIGTAELIGLAVTTAKIADDAVNAAKIATAAVGTDELAGQAVDETKLANLAVTTAKLAGLAVTAAKIADGNVTTAKLADGAVTTIKIAGQAVDTAQLANLGVTTAKVADGAVTSAKANLTGLEVEAGALHVLDTSYTTIVTTTPAAGTYLVFASVVAVQVGGGNSDVFLKFIDEGEECAETLCSGDTGPQTLTGGQVRTVNGSQAIAIQAKSLAPSVQTPAGKRCHMTLLRTG